eukprot:UN3992
MRAQTANLAMLLIACSRVLVCIPVIVLVDSLGRRPLLLTSCFGVSAAMALAAVFYFAGMPGLPWKLATFTLFFNSYSPGLGCTSYVYAGEVMDNLLRSKGMSIAIFGARVIGSVMLLAYPAVRDHLGDGVAFCILAGINALGLIFLFMCAPETKGLRLESVSQCFDDSPQDPW